MKNRNLERSKDLATNMIDELVYEIEDLESQIDSLTDELGNSLDRIRELESELKRVKR